MIYLLIILPLMLALFVVGIGAYVWLGLAVAWMAEFPWEAAYR